VTELLLTVRLQIVAVEDGERQIFELEAKLRATNEHQNPNLVAYFVTDANQLYIAAEFFK
jgi:hypothetical protein